MKKVKLAMKGSIVYRALRWAFYLPERIYCSLRYHLLEKSHRLSVRLSRRTGVSAIKRKPELIISLTTIPARISAVALSLDCLLRQSLKPDRLILWLSESNDPGSMLISERHLPADLQRLMRRGLEVRWCRDIRSYRKIIPTLQAHSDALIVTADDDILYPRHWLRMLYEAYLREPNFIHCHRAHLMKYDQAGVILPYRQWQFSASGHVEPSPDLFPTGGGGVLYAPGHLHSEVLNELAFMSLCPNADDVWLKAMSLMAHVECKKVASETFPLIEIQISNNPTLRSVNLYQDGNDLQIKAVAERYGVFHRQKG